jgi:hypothetical protein
MSIVINSLDIGDTLMGQTHQRAPVRCATVAAGTLISSFENGDNVGGVTLVTGDEILIKDQVSADENGFYEVQVSGAPIRRYDLDTDSVANGVTVHIKEGTLANTIWTCTSAVSSDIVGTNTLSFAQMDVIGTLSVARGGTGVSTFASGNVLVGAGTSSPTATKAAPIGDFVGTTDTQTMSNKTLTAPIVSGDIVFDEATNDLTFAVTDQTNAVSATIPNLLTSQDFVFTDLIQTLANKTLTDPILKDDSLELVGSTDDTKKLILDPTGGATSTSTTLLTSQTGNVTLTLPDESGTLATQAYADAVAEGLHVKEPVVAAGTIDLNSNTTISGVITYSSTGGSSGRGQITATLVTTDVFTVDTITFAAVDDGSRILLKNQTSADQNGIWTTTVSTTSLTLDRATDFDQDAEVVDGSYIWVGQGSVNVDSSYVLTTNDPIIIGGASGTSLVFIKFSSAEQINDGDGIIKSGNTISADLKVNGGLVFETTEIALDLGASNITGTLIVSDGGTGASTHGNGNVLLGAGTGAVTSTKAAPSGDFVGTTDVQVLSGKTLTGLEINDTSADHQYVVTVNELSANRNVELPLLLSDDVFVFSDYIQTLTNKTLTSPIIDEIKSDASDIIINFTDAGTSVNYFEMINAAAASGPTLKVDPASSGTNIDMNFITKGTGALNLAASGASSGELRLLDDDDSAYTGLKSNAAVTTSYTITFPPAVGTNGQVLQTDTSGNLSWATVGTTSKQHTYAIVPAEVRVKPITYTTVGIFAWNDTSYSASSLRTLVFEVADVGAGGSNRGLDIRLQDVTNTSTLTSISSITSVGFKSESFTDPGANARLELQVKKSAVGGTNPSIFGIQLEFQI